jgi:tRNA nucleotidyltransferase (CCA-adding enzyme)
MQIFLVGGAVRDELLGLPVAERDWVVVGATPDDLTRLGYRQVGKDFPVFLHPDTREEYALARTERKTGPGYHGFAVCFSPDVTLEEDLRRRDLTVNAMARAADGSLIDPYGGRNDLSARILRHVSPAFSEDPVRILRLARFAARFAPLGFTVALETADLLTQMVRAGEVEALVAERVWAETAKALRESHPSVYFATLAGCGALAAVFPEIDSLTAAPGGLDAALATLDRAAADGAAPRVRFAALMLHLGGVEPVESLCARGRIPTEFRELAVASRRALAAEPVSHLEPQALLAFLESADALRRPERFAEIVAALGARLPGGMHPRSRQYARALETVQGVVVDPAERAALRGPAIGERLRTMRLAALGAMASD